MPWNGVVSSLWNQTKLYKRWLTTALSDTGVCVICQGHTAAEVSVCRGCDADLPRRSSRLKRKISNVDEALVAFRYEFPITELVKAAKFHGDLGALSALAVGFDAAFAAQLNETDVLIPVPLLPWRFVRRGYNQAAELARVLGGMTGIPVRQDLVHRRQVWGVAQSRLDASARRENVRAAFRVSRSVAGLRVAIVDDVITTGATCEALASALQAAGATKIIAVAVAATPFRQDAPVA